MLQLRLVYSRIPVAMCITTFLYYTIAKYLIIAISKVITSNTEAVQSHSFQNWKAADSSQYDVVGGS